MYDTNDKCPKGNLDWTSSVSTDFDSDGCRDAGEDLDDDNDLICDSVSPPSASDIADSVIGNGLSGLTGPTTSAEVTCISWPCSLSVGSTRPLITTLDSISALFNSSKLSSPTDSRLITH